MKKALFLAFTLLLFWTAVSLLFEKENRNSEKVNVNSEQLVIKKENLGGLVEEKITHPLMVEEMRQKEYPGSEIGIEQGLSPGSNYDRYIVSYKSEGLKIFALLTVPFGDPPAGGFPAIVFNHGYIPPEQYQTTERYVDYVAGFARNGYVVIKPDYRGHGNSEGRPEGAYFSPAYTVDVLNAVSSIKKYEKVNPEKIGMWGHSLGGHITLRSMVVSGDIKAGVIWAGVAVSYEDFFSKWHSQTPWYPSPREQSFHRPSSTDLVEEFGSLEENQEFWRSISPIYFVGDLSGPVQLHHGKADGTVPYEFSEILKEALENANKEVELYLYEGADHNISGDAFTSAMTRSVEFFDRYLK